MNQELEQTTSFSSSSGSNRSMNTSVRMGTGAPLAPPSLLIPGKHLPEPTSLIEMQQGSPMDVSVLTTSVETPKLTPPLGCGAEGDSVINNNHNKEEKVGRWSEQEHKVFLEGLERYGKQWKTIAQMIGTRTVVQVRTHAQKYFQKMERKNKDSSNKHNSSSATTTGSVTGSVSSSTCSSSAAAAATAAALVSTPIPSPRMTVKTTTTASKRKSLTGSVTAASAPSRKKSKSPKKTTPRVVSLSLSTTSPPPSSLELPHFMSNASSLENLSTISPVGVADMDLGLVSSYSTINTCGEVSFAMPKNSSQFNFNNMYAMEVNVGGMIDHQEAEVGLDVAAADLGDDPLEWLIDGGINHLPESSLESAPMFPDFSDISAENHLTVQVQPKSFDPTSFLQEIADPKVTVQSLFLETPAPDATQALS